MESFDWTWNFSEGPGKGSTYKTRISGTQNNLSKNGLNKAFSLLFAKFIDFLKF